MIGLAMGLAAVQPPYVLPTLDVPAAISALETQQVYAAPGAANIDIGAVTRELAPDMRLVLEPFRQFPVTNQYHGERVTTPLETWADGRNIRLITVEGLNGWYANTFPRNLTDLRQQMAYVDATGPVLAAIRAQTDPGRTEQGFPSYQSLTPTPDQVADLAGKLRRNQVHDTTGRTDGYGITGETRLLGRAVRAALLPPLSRGEPFVDYAPALAREFPDDVVLVAQGLWVDVVGKDQLRLDSARNFSYKSAGWAFRRGDLGDIVDSITARLEGLSRHKPLGPPPSQTDSVAQTVDGYLPLLWAVAAGVLGSGVLVGFVLRRRRRRRAEAALRKARSRARAAISELGAVLADSPRPDAAERLKAARELFERAGTTAEMVDVERVADEGLGCFGLSALSSAAPARLKRVAVRQPGPVRRLLWRTKYWVVPRWVAGGVLAGVVTCVALPLDQMTPSDDVRAIVDGLRDNPVYVKPGVLPLADPEQVRQVLGDRPIVMVLIPGVFHSGASDLCDQIAAHARGNVVVVYGGESRVYPTACTAADSNTERSLINDRKFVFDVEVAAFSATEYRDWHDFTIPWVTEFVMAFDASAADPHARFPRSPTDTVPSRAAVPMYLTSSGIALVYGGIVALCLAVSFLVRACQSNHPVCSAEIPAAHAAND